LPICFISLLCYSALTLGWWFLPLYSDNYEEFDQSCKTLEQIAALSVLSNSDRSVSFPIHVVIMPGNFIQIKSIHKIHHHTTPPPVFIRYQ